MFWSVRKWPYPEISLPIWLLRGRQRLRRLWRWDPLSLMARRLSRPQAVVLPVKDPTSDMAQFAKKGSALLRSMREEREKRKATQASLQDHNSWELGHLRTLMVSRHITNR